MNAWIWSWSKAFWKVEPEALRVTEARVTAVVPGVLWAVVLFLLPLLPQAAATRASAMRGPTTRAEGADMSITPSRRWVGGHARSAVWTSPSHLMNAR